MNPIKNVVVIPIVIPKDKKLDKFGGWEWMNHSKQAWQYWCDKNGHELVIYDKPSIEDTSKFRITVQRWFDIFNFLDGIIITGGNFDKSAIKIRKDVMNLKEQGLTLGIGGMKYSDLKMNFIQALRQLTIDVLEKLKYWFTLKR